MNDTDAPFRLLRKQVAAFSNITDSDWAMLEPQLQLKTLRKNDILISEGKRASALGLVTRGMFRQYYTKDGAEKTTISFLKNILSAPISVVLPANPLLLPLKP
jgi:signal-transduction protein with cAMP-binding, CBS, and nucleotidyltransferase domain